jgi:hypothetical protein
VSEKYGFQNGRCNNKKNRRLFLTCIFLHSAVSAERITPQTTSHASALAISHTSASLKVLLSVDLVHSTLRHTSQNHVKISLLFSATKVSSKSTYMLQYATQSVDHVIRINNKIPYIPLLCILFTKFSTTCFGHYYGHLQGNIIITSIKGTNVVSCVTVTP